MSNHVISHRYLSLCHPAKNAPLCYVRKQSPVRVFVRGPVQILKKTMLISKPLTRPRTNSRVFSVFFSQYVDENFAGRQRVEHCVDENSSGLCMSVMSRTCLCERNNRFGGIHRKLTSEMINQYLRCSSVSTRLTLICHASVLLAGIQSVTYPDNIDDIMAGCQLKARWHDTAYKVLRSRSQKTVVK